jgi:hypothetical protein
MKKSDWKDTAELIGIAAIVASLMFVGLEMRQTQVIARATLYQMRSDSAQAIRQSLIFPESLQSAILKGMSDLTAIERVSLNSAISMTFDHFENSHNLYLLGMLPQEQWESDKAILRDLFSDNPFAVNRWNNNKHTYRLSFVTEMDAILRSLDEAM